jgi:hypothetical protein
MLTIAPFSAVIGMVLSDPELWESSMNLETLLVFSMFGIITVPLWITYLPMTILSPFIMKYLSSQDRFYSLPIPILIALSLMFGAILGVVMISPLFILNFEKNGLELIWVVAGASSGATTLTLLTLLYRWLKPAD